MSRIKIPFKGITTSSNHEDGECSNIVNLRPKDGYLKPVPPRKTHLTLSSEYDIVFIHRVGGDISNWICVSGHSAYFLEDGSVTTIIESADERINSVQQTGNVLSFITESNIYYVLWEGTSDGYAYLGKLPDIKNVEFRSTPSMSIKGKFYSSEYEGDLAIPENEEDREVFTQKTKGLVQKIFDENKDFFHDAFIIRYAYRLYDGSITHPSSPILVMPGEHFDDWGKAFFEYEYPNYKPTSKINIKMFDLTVEYDFSANMEKWKDVIKSVDFFVSSYIGLANPNSISNMFMVFPKGADGSKNLYKRELSASDMSYRPTLSRPSAIPRNGNPDGLTSYSTGGRTSTGSFTPSGSPYWMPRTTYKPGFLDTPEDRVLNASQFFLYYSDEDYLTPKTGINAITFPNNKVTVKGDFYNIIQQELMPIDTLSHHSVGASKATTYNNRLRLSGVTTKMFRGHELSHFKWHSSYNGVAGPGIEMPEGAVVYVNIMTDQGEIIVRVSGGSSLFLNAFISYPDPRATKLRVYEITNNGYSFTERFSIVLKPHPSLNIAYALNEGLEPYLANIENAMHVGTPHYDYNPKLIEQNKLKVSELNNPFVFPNETTYQIGSGKILNESSIVMNVTDRNYGLYPTFVFTDQGVFTMAGATEDTVSASIQAPTYLEPPISDVICPTPVGVAFITQKGLMIISQHQTDILSPQLRENGDTLHLSNAGGISPLISYPIVPFTTFLKNVGNMVYNPYQDELIISSKDDLGYCYVYDFPSKSFYLSTEKFNGVVQNAFPKMYVMDGLLIKDFSQYESKAAQVSILTRPLHFGTDDIKKLERVILRALMFNVGTMSVAAFHSVDGVYFDPIKGTRFSNGNYKDFDLGLLARETYRQYIFLLTGTLDEESQVRYTEYEIVKRYDNEKMR